jgi:hypothetical protein
MDAITLLTIFVLAVAGCGLNFVLVKPVRSG